VQRRVVLDEVVPRVCRHAEADRRVRLVLGDLRAEQRRAVHPDAFRTPPSPTTAITIGVPISAAFASAPAIIRCAASVLMPLFANVCAIASPPC
jgi:hypothetical protein